jgi:hypothetical protein
MSPACLLAGAISQPDCPMWGASLVAGVEWSGEDPASPGNGAMEGPVPEQAAINQIKTPTKVIRSLALGLSRATFVPI